MLFKSHRQMSTPPTSFPTTDSATSSSTASPSTNATSRVDISPPVTPTSSASSQIICPNCSCHFSHACPSSVKVASTRIAELETQVRVLTQKAAAAVDKIADYEDELRTLRCGNQGTARPNSKDNVARNRHSPQSSNATSSTTSSLLTAVRFTSYFRRAPPPASLPPTPGLHTPQNHLSANISSHATSLSTPTISHVSLLSQKESEHLHVALEHEMSLRKSAESALSQAHEELEDLSAALFTQANEMVAKERKERRMLELQVEKLERRDVERQKRLDRLDGAVRRVVRVRSLLEGSSLTGEDTYVMGRA